jgi:hypothetical protein
MKPPQHKLSISNADDELFAPQPFVWITLTLANPRPGAERFFNLEHFGILDKNPSVDFVHPL